MELLQLKYFCDAAETESFTATAKKYTVPPSGVSQSVHRLEKELGKLLFRREANRIILSDEGRGFYRAAREALSLLDLAAERLREGDEPRGTVRLLVETNRHGVTRAIEECKGRYPSITFVLNHTDHAAEPYDLVISDRAPGRSGWHRELLVRERLLVAAERSSPLLQRETLTPEDLRGERFISMHRGSSMHTLLIRLAADAGFVPEIAIECDDPTYVRKYVEVGLGIALFPAVSWREEVREHFAVRPIGEYFRETYLWQNGRRCDSRSVSAFREILLRIFREEALKAGS